MPNNWKLITLGNLSSTITKGTTPKGGNSAYLINGIGFLRAENVIGFSKLKKDNLKYVSKKNHESQLKRSILISDDILITIAGTLGRTALVSKVDLPLNANQAISILRVINKNITNLNYLIYAINSATVQKQFNNQKKITAIPNLTLDIIKKIVIPLPPLKEQIKISNKINHLFDYINF